MNPYERQYRHLRAKGAVAWAGNGYLRAKKQQDKIFHWLNLHQYLPQPLPQYRLSASHCFSRYESAFAVMPVRRKRVNILCVAEVLILSCSAISR